MDTIIVFRVGEELIGIDIAKVREVTEVQVPVAVPRAPDFLLGLVNVRGEVVPVLSLRKRLGFGGDELGSVLLVVDHEGRVAGLKVDALLGTRKIVERNIRKDSELLSTKKEKDFFLGVYETDEKPVLILDLSKTLSKEDT
ncbi:MAG TPA: chemotaxis protein CheW [bacterium]